MEPGVIRVGGGFHHLRFERHPVGSHRRSLLRRVFGRANERRIAPCRVGVPHRCFFYLARCDCERQDCSGPPERRRARPELSRGSARILDRDREFSRAGQEARGEAHPGWLHHCLHHRPRSHGIKRGSDRDGGRIARRMRGCRPCSGPGNRPGSDTRVARRLLLRDFGFCGRAREDTNISAQGSAGRTDLWQIALQVASRHPLGGVG